jgi:quercetin dioxygenase-like cupin family protein
MKAKLLGLAAGCAIAFAATPALAADPPIVAKPVAAGTMKATTIRANAGTMLFESVRVAPGGSFGWHTHGAPAAVVVTAGTLTVLDPAVNGCAPFRVSKGASFVEPANHVHLARNDGKTPASVFLVYLGLPKAGAAVVPAATPAGCDA